MHLRLSDNSIKNMEAAVLLKKKGRHQCEVRDSRIGGFFIIIGKRTKSFAIQADLRKDGKRIRIIRRTIGRFGDITTRRARLIAQQDILSINQGIIQRWSQKIGQCVKLLF